MAMGLIWIATCLVSVSCAASHALSRKVQHAVRTRRIDHSRSAPLAALPDEEEVDVIVIGAGVGGLSCGAMAARYGLKVLVLESHSIAGGCAHGFERGGFLFDSGPSLFNGMGKPSTNPLRQVLDACGEQVEWLSYDGWEMILPQGRFYFRCGDAASWEQTLTRFGGPNVLREWQALSKFVAPITAAAAAIPPLCLRDDAGALVTIALHGLKGFLSAAPVAKLLTAPFSTTLERAAVTDPFLLAWFDYLAFALSGLDASGTLGAAVAYTMGDLYPAGCALDYPVGGSAAVVDALVRAISARGGRVQTSAHVQAIEVDDTGRAAAVTLRGGRRVRARRAVVSNAHVAATVALLPEALRPAPRPGSGGPLNTALEMTPSFMHLHLGVRADGMAEAAAAAGGPLRIHYSVVLDDFSAILADRNMVIVSIPTVLDPSLAPAGHHLVHA
jgi:phytoene dehydrogenase-like protein